VGRLLGRAVDPPSVTLPEWFLRPWRLAVVARRVPMDRELIAWSEWLPEDPEALGLLGHEHGVAYEPPYFDGLLSRNYAGPYLRQRREMLLAREAVEGARRRLAGSGN